MTDRKITAREWARHTQRPIDAEHAEAIKEWRERIRTLQAPDPYPPMKKRPKLGKTILVIGDTHMAPGQDLRRMEWLGHAITDLKPDVVVCLGDAWSMDSLASFDAPGSKAFEGRRYWADIDIGISGRLRTQAVVDNYNRPRKKKDRIEPRFVALLGNHENRITKFIESDVGRRFEGMVGLHDLRQTEPECGAWEQIPFLQSLEIAGISFCHYWPSGLMNRATSSTNVMLNRQHVSCIAGHSHLYQHSVATGGDGLMRHAIMAGCYFSHFEEWAQQANLLWRRGLLLLTDCDGLGDFDHTWLGMHQVKARYG